MNPQPEAEDSSHNSLRCILGSNQSKQAAVLAKLVNVVEKPLRRVQEKNLVNARVEVAEMSDETAEAAVMELVNTIAEYWAAECPKLVSTKLRRQACKRRAFEKRLEKVWGGTFKLLRTFEVISYESGAELNAISMPTTRALRYVLLHLHARACKVFGEICLLLEHGYADGAHARWRSLHETAVVAQFLSLHGDRGAMLYLEHEAVENHKGAREYQKHAPSLRYEPLDEATLKELEKRSDDMIKKHGASFGTPYGWAAVLLDSPRPGLEALEAATGLDRLRPFYRMASYAVHANPKSFRFSLSQRDLQFRLAGPSNAGIADPAHGAAISMAQVCGALLKGVETIDAVALIKLMGLFSERVGAEAIAAHDLVEKMSVFDGKADENPDELAARGEN